MNRIIKFRAWDKTIKRMDKVLRIDLESQRVITENKVTGEERLLRSVFEVKPNHELMQFTGLLDKDGKEIYEGDILRRWINSRGKVYPSNAKIHQIVVAITYGDLNIKSKEKYQLDRFEIIGTIYENPELLAPNLNK